MTLRVTHRDNYGYRWLTLPSVAAFHVPTLYARTALASSTPGTSAHAGFRGALLAAADEPVPFGLHVRSRLARDDFAVLSTSGSPTFATGQPHEGRAIQAVRVGFALQRGSQNLQVADPSLPTPPGVPRLPSHLA